MVLFDNVVKPLSHFVWKRLFRMFIYFLFISYLFWPTSYYLQSGDRVLFIMTAAVTTLASLVAHLKQGQELVTIILNLLWTKYFVKNVIKP